MIFGLHQLICVHLIDVCLRLDFSSRNSMYIADFTWCARQHNSIDDEILSRLVLMIKECNCAFRRCTAGSDFDPYCRASNFDFFFMHRFFSKKKMFVFRVLIYSKYCTDGTIPQIFNGRSKIFY